MKNTTIRALAFNAITAITAVAAISTPSLMAVAAQSMTAASQDDAAKNLNRLLTNTKSMSASFSQTTKAGKKTTNFSGVMSVQRQNQFRWETKQPAEQLIVANGSTLWVYDKDLQQVTKQSVSNQVGDTPALLLSGNPAQISQNFNISQPNAAKNYYVLTPKSANANFKSLTLSFNGGRPVMMVLNDNIGQETVIRFSNITMNKRIAASQFDFKPPAGVDIINQ
ncbi:outer membrane lipoprotein chaperone LolA [Moraxella nasicaprae]|uniref:Outer-membrane lipoprotein carrier protein n=1 Tax=Moraxella nasicaprae TaxID=2904122 RepID=A0ABY6F3A6_9GAMM|nr:outer membrane lipoprotein chaperone LolA [Moraxella nasicaprae]UXZ04571.1 outer membrane lipoprotein chaperone LolA [Moraxella nasicaprae]